MVGEEGIQRAGQVDIKELSLISSDNQIISLKDGFFSELHLFEDMFLNYMHGYVLITDKRNLIQELNIHGEEFLNLEFKTPSFPEKDVIKKTFRVYKLTDREIVQDTNTQTYTLHFMSVEMFNDVLLPLFGSYEGDIKDVVQTIFESFIAESRNYIISIDHKEIKENEQPTSLIILNEPSNRVKFVSPGWSPFKCINWLASKSLSKDFQAKNFIFFESNKNFYFGSVESIFKDANENNILLGEYTISVSNLDKKDRNREMFLAKDVKMVETVGYFKNYTSGYLSNRLIYLDVFNKNYELIDYDHIEQYKKQHHSSGLKTSIPVFSYQAVKTFANNISFYSKNPKLFNNFENNVNEKMGEIHGNRLSSLLELGLIKMDMTIPGRTDAEVGCMIKFMYPAVSPKSQENKSLDNMDKLYSGNYLITAIRHVITSQSHGMHLQAVKDSLYVDGESTKLVDYAENF